MTLDWQNIAVLLIVLAAAFYVGRRGWARVRSFRARGADEAACATGCGSCAATKPTEARTAAGTTMVQIERAGSRRPTAR